MILSAIILRTFSFDDVLHTIIRRKLMLHFLGTWIGKVPALEPKLPKSLFVYKFGELQIAMFWHA